MHSELSGIPFIGENGYYPQWARRSGRWVFQRTLVETGGILFGIARLHAAGVPVSDQMIVWVPPTRLPILGALPSAIHRERQAALGALGRLRLVCYGENCSAPKPDSTSLGMAATSVVRESGVQPDKWLLVCPLCGATVGPDIACVSAIPIVRRWEAFGRPRLENPGAGAGMRSIAAVADLPDWIERLEPSHLELAYLGQQMWPDIEIMLAAMTEI